MKLRCRAGVAPGAARAGAAGQWRPASGARTPGPAPQPASPPEPVLHVAYRHLYLVYTEYLLAYLPNILLSLYSATIKIFIDGIEEGRETDEH